MNAKDIMERDIERALAVEPFHLFHGTPEPIVGRLHAGGDGFLASWYAVHNKRLAGSIVF